MKNGNLITNLYSNVLPKDLRFGTGFYIDSFGSFREKTLLILMDDLRVDGGLNLVGVGGFKRGSVFVELPPEANGAAMTISRVWLIDNWNNWVDLESEAKSVYVIPDILDALGSFLDASVFSI